MFIELYRAWIPEHMHEDTCGVCSREVAPTSVIASVAADDRWDMGVACPACIAYLGSRSPERSPTIERYLELLRRFPAPMYASQEELEAAYEDSEDPENAAYEEAWVWRPQEEERLRDLLNRCDALGNAYAAVLEEEGVDAEMKAKTLGILEEMKEEANESFRRYKRGVGLEMPAA